MSPASVAVDGGAASSPYVAPRPNGSSQRA